MEIKLTACVRCKSEEPCCVVHAVMDEPAGKTGAGCKIHQQVNTDTSPGGRVVVTSV